MTNKLLNRVLSAPVLCAILIAGAQFGCSGDAETVSNGPDVEVDGDSASTDALRLQDSFGDGSAASSDTADESPDALSAHDGAQAVEDVPTQADASDVVDVPLGDEVSADGGADSEPDSKCKVGADCPPSKPSCMHFSSESYCVACIIDAHCGAGQRCLGQVCAAASQCVSDKQCGVDGVCSSTEGQCVGCNAPADCALGGPCVANSCLPPEVKCQSSKECAPYGQVCGATGACVECGSASDCLVDGETCLQGFCVTAVCVPTAVQCSAKSGERQVCSAGGTVWLPKPCESTSTCVSGNCVSVVCKPGASRCKGLDVEICNANGTSWKTSKSCGNEEVCKQKTPADAAACGPKPVCEPSSKTCSDDGSAVHNCNAAGSGWVSVSCNAGEVCSNGVCGAKKCAAWSWETTTIGDDEYHPVVASDTQSVLWGYVVKGSAYEARAERRNLSDGSLLWSKSITKAKIVGYGQRTLAASGTTVAYAFAAGPASSGPWTAHVSLRSLATGVETGKVTIPVVAGYANKTYPHDVILLKDGNVLVATRHSAQGAGQTYAVHLLTPSGPTVWSMPFTKNQADLCKNLHYLKKPASSGLVWVACAVTNGTMLNTLSVSSGALQSSKLIQYNVKAVPNVDDVALHGKLFALVNGENNGQVTLWSGEMALATSGAPVKSTLGKGVSASVKTVGLVPIGPSGWLWFGGANAGLSKAPVALAGRHDQNLKKVWVWNSPLGTSVPTFAHAGSPLADGGVVLAGVKGGDVWLRRLLPDGSESCSP